MPQGQATLTFSDEFNSLNLWNGATGTWSTNFWWAEPTGKGSTLEGNGEQQWYINADYAATASVRPWTVDNGVLTLTAAPASPPIQALINGYRYTSGELNTFHTFSQTYGYFEMRAELPAGQGVWPAFWLLPANGAWPPELDIFEVLGNEPDKVYTTVHTMDTGSHTSSGIGSVVADTSVGYHTYGVDWEADTITWYYDGKAIYHVATPVDMHQAMYMVTNLAVGGFWPGMVNSSTPLPAHMNIDYVHVYSSMPSDAAAAAAAAAAGAASAAAAQLATNGGLVLVGHTDTGNTLVGSAGTDTLTGGYTADILTGGAGADTFVFKYLPWNAGHITDFTVGVDKLDLSALLWASGYHGTDPVADGYLSFASDGAGGTKVMYDSDGRGTANPWPITLITLDHVSPAGLTSATLLGGGSVAPGSLTAVTAPTVTVAALPTVLALPAAPAAPAMLNPPAAGAAAGQVLTAADATPTVLNGGAGADTLTGGHNADTLIGGAGADTFVFKYLPWNAGHITDFAVGVDKLDVSALLTASGYQGVDPVADGYLILQSDGAGGTRVLFDSDGPGSANPWPTTVTTLDNVSPTGLTAAALFNGSSAGAPAPSVPTPAAAVPGPAAAVPGPIPAAPVPSLTPAAAGFGLTLTAADAAATVLTGGAGADTLTAGHASDLLTGGAGADTFVFKYLPWNAGHITDFTPGVDKLDLSTIASAAGYHGLDPIGDGYLSLRDDGYGGTQVYFDTDGAAPGNPWPFLITTLDHVAPSAIHASDWVI